MRKRTRRLILAAAAAVILAAGAHAAWEWVWLRRAGRIDVRLERYRELIWRHARANDLPVGLVGAVIRAESGGDARAVSPKGARGLMQVTPIAEREVLGRLGRPAGDPFDADYNILLGTTYLRMMVDRFDGDVRLALAAYNWGPTHVSRLRAAHPHLASRRLIDMHAPRVTARYVRTILGPKAPRLPATRGGR